MVKNELNTLVRLIPRLDENIKYTIYPYPLGSVRVLVSMQSSTISR